MPFVKHINVIHYTVTLKIVCKTNCSFYKPRVKKGLFMSQTIAALATPAGMGGIAVVRLSGTQATQIAQKVFAPVNKNKNLTSAKGYTAMFGHFLQNNKICDEVVALVFKAPHSYTGEDVVELSCHGGNAVSAVLLRALYDAGAVPAGAGEFTKRAFLNGRISLTQAEAVMDMIGAAGVDGAKAAAAAMEGALYKKIQQVQQNLLTIAGHIAAYTDYPEEDVPALEDEQLQSTLQHCLAVLKQLIDGYDAGAVMRRGIKTAIVGSPNVGKSTLLNLLAGFERAIVTPIAGTTRDVVQQEVDLNGVHLLLADTAGMHETDDVVEAEGIRRSKAEMEKAGLVLAVFDASANVSEADIELAKACADKRAVAIINKADLATCFDEQKIAPYFTQIVQGSAKQTGFESDISNAVHSVLNVTGFDADAAMLANERQLTAAKNAYFALQEAQNAMQLGITLDAIGVCIDDAHHALVQLTGEDATEDVINEVFSKFCVGK